MTTDQHGLQIFVDPVFFNIQLLGKILAIKRVRNSIKVNEILLKIFHQHGDVTCNHRKGAHVEGWGGGVGWWGGGGCARYGHPTVPRH